MCFNFYYSSLHISYFSVNIKQFSPYIVRDYGVNQLFLCGSPCPLIDIQENQQGGFPVLPNCLYESAEKMNMYFRMMQSFIFF